jgi:Tetratricopeptide repeat
MSARKLLFLCVGISLTASGVAQAQHHMGGSVSWHGGQLGGGGGRRTILSGGPFFVGVGYYGGLYAPIPYFMVVPAGAFIPGIGPVAAGPNWNRGPLLPPPPPGWMQPQANAKPAEAKRSDPGRSSQLTTVGDRLFRAGNFKKARERYEQAVRAAPDVALPRARLAQVALTRGNYAEAASFLREAETAQPGWIITAPDFQAIFGEPGEFAKTLARLESHLQTHPDDRDAWLVLGAEWFLSGRTAKAADVFRRLDERTRKPDVALAAFLDASNQPRPNLPPAPQER